MKKQKLKIGCGIVALSFFSGVVLSKTPINSKEVIVLKHENTMIKEWEESIKVNEQKWNIVNDNSIVKTTWISETNQNVPFETNISVLNSFETEKETLKYNVFGECLNMDVIEGNEYITKEEYDKQVKKTKKLKKQYPGLFAN